MAGKKERQRRLARERYERRTQRQAQEDKEIGQVRRWTVGALAVVAVVAVGVGAFFLFSGSPGKTTAEPTVARPPSEPARHCTYTASPPAARNVGFPGHPRLQGRLSGDHHHQPGQHRH